MGRDKALLPLERATMVEEIAARVRGAAGNVRLMGSPEKYGHLGLPVVAAEIENCGPLGGLYTALRIHRRVGPVAEAAIHRNLFKMQDFISILRTSSWPVADPRPLYNVNTPAEWSGR